MPIIQQENGGVRKNKDIRLKNGYGDHLVFFSELAQNNTKTRDIGRPFIA